MSKQKKYTSLRRRTLITMGLMLVGLVLIVYLILKSIMLSSVTELEHQDVQENLERVQSAIVDDLGRMASIAEDWGAWDDTYYFVNGKNESYVKNNLQIETFLNLKLNVMIFTNNSGELVFAKGADLKDESEMPLPDGLLAHLEKSLLLSRLDPDFKIQGIILLPDGPMLITSHPILKSNYDGPVAGNAIIGRFLNDEVVSQLSEKLKLTLFSHRLDKSPLVDFGRITEKMPFLIQPLSNSIIAGYVVMDDIYGQPAIGLNVEMFRKINRIGSNAIHYMFYSLIAVGLVFTIGMLFFLEKNILSRLLKLSISVQSIGSRKDLSVRLQAEVKKDELSVVSNEINEMLDKLEVSQQSIRESEEKYRTFVEKATDIIYSLDKDGCFTYISPNCVGAFGNEPSTIVGTTYASFLHPDDLSGWVDFMSKMVEFNEQNRSYEHRVKGKNETYNWYRTDISVLTDTHTGEPYFLGIFYDIQKRKLAEESLQQEHSELLEKRVKELAKVNKSLRLEIIERKKIQERIKYLAYHDQLTGLSNRLLFTDRLTQAILQAERTGKSIAVLFLDLDAFKMVNGTMGHAQGDELLKEVSKRLLKTLRKSDTAARLGGDEFIIMTPLLKNENNITIIAEKILSIFNPIFRLNNQDCFVTASIGAAVYPTDGEDAEVLIKNADIAMYKAKENGRNKYMLCTSLMKAKALDTVKLTDNLSRALGRNELVLYYQPQVSFSSSSIVGAEALLRWFSPNFGLVSPGKFIPIAEQTGLIIPIGEWVLRTACKQNKVWQDAGLAEIRMAVNLSMNQFKNPEIVDQVAAILAETGLNPKFLELEITENVAMKETEYIAGILTAFKELGVTISIDDFGTEYSSLNYLKQLPIDRIKIARQFVQGITLNVKDEAIINAIIVLARNLKINVIAEGVETQKQLSFLTQLMCDEIQGYFYYKPMPVLEMEELLKSKTLILPAYQRGKS